VSRTDRERRRADALTSTDAGSVAKPRARDLSSWHTAISDASGDELVVRGHRLGSLIGNVSFTEMAFLVLGGRLPSREERDLLDAVLVSVMDHGIAPAAVIVRMLASFGVPLQAGLAGGALTFGDWHGGACEQAARLLADAVATAWPDADADREATLRAHLRDLVRERVDAGGRLEGFGHPLHPVGDPRVERLLELAREVRLFGRHCRALVLLEEELADRLRRPIPINIDGVIAAIVLDLGFPWQAARCFLVTPRTVGMTAHFLEELAQGGRWRHADPSTVRYEGDRAPSGDASPDSPE
jgi:citrate synthase